MSYLKYSLIAFLLMMPALTVMAQDRSVGMADTMRSNGRIYVVVAVMVTILAGVIIYLVRIDRKISRLEKDIHSKH
jgi:hypothetical protein